MTEEIIKEEFDKAFKKNFPEAVIIDGVDVAGCRHCMYKGFKAFPQCRLELDSFATACTQHKECEYKQLKRLEKENKELKEKVKSLESEIRQKKMTIMMNNDHYLTVDENNRKYRSALEEIRILATKNVSIENFVKIQNKINEVLNDSEG